MQSRTKSNSNKLIDLTGKRFGKWVVVGRSMLRNTYSPFLRRWDVVCDCGTVANLDGVTLRTGDATNCGCNRNAAFRKRPYEALYNLFEKAVEKSTRINLITYEQFAKLAEQTSCHYCGAPVAFQKHSPKSAAYRLDRKDNSKHYTMDNVVVCCTDCNYAKGARYTYDEWRAMTKALKRVRKVTPQAIKPKEETPIDQQSN